MLLGSEEGAGCRLEAGGTRLCVSRSALSDSLPGSVPDGSPQGSPLPGAFQARTLEWVAISPSGESFPRRDRSPGRDLYLLSHREAPGVCKLCVKVAQSCPTLCNPADYTVHGILQARRLQWAAIPFSRGSSQPRDRTQVSRITGGFFTFRATKEAQGWAKYGVIL